MSVMCQGTPFYGLNVNIDRCSDAIIPLCLGCTVACISSNLINSGKVMAGFYVKLVQIEKLIGLRSHFVTGFTIQDIEK